MYALSRLMLSLTVIGCCVCLVAVAAYSGGVALIAIPIALIAVAVRRRSGVFTAHGTARWATLKDLQYAGMVGAKSGPIIGRVANNAKTPLVKALNDLFRLRVSSNESCEQFFDAIRYFNRPQRQSELIRLSNCVHCAIFAPTGVGKGVSCVIPFLQTSNESAVVVDFKGENYQLTAEHRRKAFGHQIVALDPFKVVTQTPDSFNPLDFIDKDSPTALDECRDLAEALVIRTGQEREMHWVDSAEAWIAALTALVVHYGEPNDRSLQTVRTLLASPEKLEMAIKLMCSSDAWGGMLARMGNQLTHYKDKELNSVMTTTGRFLRFLDTLAVAECTKKSSFNPADLRKGKMTIYLILPPEHMRAQSPLLRMWIGSLLRAVVREGLQEWNKVHFVLDEAASLGRMDAIDDGLDKLRGYGVRLLFFYQSVSQLKKCFPDGQDQVVLGNVSQVFFGTMELSTAEYVSNRLGEQTIVVSSGGMSTGTSHQMSSKGDGSTTHSRNASDNWAQLGRKLLKPEEVLALDKRIAITFTPGVPPIWTTLVRYYEESLDGGGPGYCERFKAAAGVLFKSAALLAMVCALIYSL